MEEIWAKIPGFEDYSVSSFGRVRSDVTGRIRKTTVSKKGYERCGLYRNKKLQYIAVHRLVCLAHVPNPENKPTVNHINGIKLDNRIENLEWNTVSENVKHSYDTGLNVFPRGSKHFASKIDEECVRMIRRLGKSKIPQWRIGEIFGIIQQNVSLICAGKAWTHVT